MISVIFGANGQDGYYLADLLRSLGHNVIGVSRGGDYLRTNISSFDEVAELVRVHHPNFIFHLAADSTTKHEAMFANHSTISTGTLNILEAVRLYQPGCKVFISGSGLQFENHDRPIKETDPFEARDPYSVSRIQSVFAARYFRRLGIKAYVGYLFNHDSPRRSERHMAQKIAAAVRRIANGSAEMIEVGDRNTIKEWTFAGDVVRGIWHLVSQEVVMEANIGSGKGYSIQDWINVCFQLIGKNPEIHVIDVPGFKAEYKQLVSDSSLMKSIGFSADTSFEELAKMMLYAGEA
jgi:GDPmannose 4,6-dehydratase